MDRFVRMGRYLLNVLIPLFGWVLLCTLGPWCLRFFMPFVIGWILASVANPLVRFLEKRLKIVRRHGSIVVVVLVLAGDIGLFYLGISRLIIQGMNLVRDLPMIYELAKEEILEAWGKLSHLFVRFPLGMQTFFNEFWSNLGTYIGTLIQNIATPTVAAAGNVAKQIPSAFVNFIITLLSSYFFIAEREGIIAAVKKRLPAWIGKYITFLKGDAKRLIGGYFLAQFRIMFVVAGVLAVGFFVLGVHYSLVLAVLLAFLDFLPMFGTGTALGPWAVVKLLSGEYAFAAGLILLYLLTQVVRQVIQPKIVGDTMGLPPLTTLFLLYLGFKLRGIAGMILAVPVGLLAASLYRSGAFDAIVENGKSFVEEVQRFRKGE